MVRTGTRLPSFCLNSVATRVRVRSPPPINLKPLSSEACKFKEPLSNADDKCRVNGGKQDMGGHGRRIMVVVDSSPESKAALQWALSHLVLSNDTVVLVEIVKPSMHGERSQGEGHPKGYELLHAMKRICQARKPEVQVELSAVDGKERGPTIVEEASRQGASLLVMGQTKRSTTWRLIMLWADNKMEGGNAVDYCIQNAACMALAVRRKSRRGGGYLITTKRHRDFWLLA